ncbi:MAG: ribosome recycling factor [Candidatus Kerfeldbacteria bacterium]|nr:ribosome recycling factor [Candidatus Kerfeldbacteria bacterium]
MLPQLNNLTVALDKTLDHFKSELSALRSGRVTPALVEHIKVEAYGMMTPLIELASINAPEPRLIIIQPWDKNITKEIDKSLQAANLGAQPVIDGALIRLNFPALNEERRQELVKQLGVKAEATKVAIKNTREDLSKSLKADKEFGQLSEDNFFLAQKELQKIIDNYNARIKKITEDKEKEIMTI